MKIFLKSKFNFIFDKYVSTSIEEFKKVSMETIDAYLKKNKSLMIGYGVFTAIQNHFFKYLTKYLNVRYIKFYQTNLFTCFSNDMRYQIIWKKIKIGSYEE